MNLILVVFDLLAYDFIFGALRGAKNLFILIRKRFASAPFGR